jgi:hypothetical protein
MNHFVYQVMVHVQSIHGGLPRLTANTRLRDQTRSLVPSNSSLVRSSFTIRNPLSAILKSTPLLSTDGVHHYDEYGLRNIEDEPFEILNIHKEEIGFVKAWLEEWDAMHT